MASISFADSMSFNIDLTGSRGGEIYVVFQQSEKETPSRRKTTLLSKMNIETEDGEAKNINFSIEDQGSARLDAMSATIHTRETLVFESNIEVVDAIKTFFEMNDEEENVLLLSHGENGDKFIMRVPNETIVSRGGKVIGRQNTDEMEEKKGASREKGELKAYETPTNLFASMFSVMDKSMATKYIVATGAKKIESRLKTIKSLKMDIENKFGIKYAQAIFANASLHLMATSFEDKREDAKKNLGLLQDEVRKGVEYIADEVGKGIDEKITTMIQFASDIDDLGKDHGYLRSIRNKQDEFKEAFGASPKVPDQIPVFDPQAGSGEGILNGMDEAKFDGILTGIELRDMEEAKKKWGDRYLVEDKTNTMLVAEDIKQHVFLSKIYGHATEEMFTYINPPYTNDDTVGKETIKMFVNGTMISGLFPTKMEAFLEKNLSDDSVIIDIPKSLTGYTEDNVPERMIFVFGTKYSKSEALESGTKTIKSNDVAKFTVQDNADAKKTFENILKNHIEKRSMMSSRLASMMDYLSASKGRKHILMEQISKRVKEVKSLISMEGIILESAKSTTPDIIKKMLPTEIAKKKKIFMDTRFYSKEGVYTRLNFQEVSQNIPLLMHYKENSPALFNLIVEVADDLNISLPVDTTIKNEEFVFGEKPNVKKDKVTNMAMGMMKLYYYPSKISLQHKSDKDTLFYLMEELRPNMGDDEKEALKKAIEFARTITIKSKRIVDSQSNSLMPQECFILQDDYGFDVGELMVDLDEFYDILKEKELFDLSDYVELANLSPEKKRQIMQGFIEDMDFVFREIEAVTDTPVEKIKKDTLSLAKRLEIARQRGEMTESDIHRYIFEFATKYKLKDLFENLSKFDFDAMVTKIKSITREKLAVSTSAANAIAEAYSSYFKSNPIAFFEQGETKFFEELAKVLSKEYDDASQMKQDIADYSEMISDVVTPIYQEKIAIATAYSRLSEILVRGYGLVSLFGIDKSKRDEHIGNVYDRVFRPMLRNIMGLKPHQVNEAERYCEIGSRLYMMAHEMRSGKTRTFLLTSCMLSWMKNTPVNIVIESNNAYDITQQAQESFPFLALKGRFFVDNKKIGFNPEKTFSALPTNEVVPKPTTLAKKQTMFRGGGDTSDMLKRRYGKDIEMILQGIENKYGSDMEAMMRDLKEKHSDSPFVKILEGACGK